VPQRKVKKIRIGKGENLTVNTAPNSISGLKTTSEINLDGNVFYVAKRKQRTEDASQYIM
jgi:hypothetical protein